MHFWKKKIQESIKWRYFFSWLSSSLQCSLAFWKEYFTYYSMFRSWLPKQSSADSISKHSTVRTHQQKLKGSWLYTMPIIHFSSRGGKTSFTKISLTHTAHKNITANSNTVPLCFFENNYNSTKLKIQIPFPFIHFMSFIPLCPENTTLSQSWEQCSLNG